MSLKPSTVPPNTWAAKETSDKNEIQVFKAMTQNPLFLPSIHFIPTFMAIFLLVQMLGLMSTTFSESPEFFSFLPVF